MFDISSVDWFIWEDVDTAHVFRNNDLVKMTENEFAAFAITAPGRAHIVLPLGRYGDATRTIEVITPCTVRELLTAIKEFYARPIESEQEISDVEDDGLGYLEDVMDKLRSGETPKMHELNGTAELRRPVPEGKRRHCLGDCRGLMRFEGISHEFLNVYQLVLGS